MGPEFDVLVVGAGPAGSACALTLARKGVRVLILEKAAAPGEKNVSGGVVYGDYTKQYGLVSLVPEFEADAPLERRIVAHQVNILSEPDARDGSYKHYKLDGNSVLSRLGLFTVELQTGHDHSICRRQFDEWLAGRAVSAGASISTGTTARELLTEDGFVTGVRTDKGGDVRANLVVDCSGVTSDLASMAGVGKGRFGPRQLYHAVKHVYKLDPETIEKRLRLKPGEGRVLNYFGGFMRGMQGTAIVCPNKETVSVSLVVAMDSLIRELTERFDTTGKCVDVLERFEAHPAIAEMLEGGQLLEFSAHNIPRGPNSIISRPYANGYLVTGDALGAFIKIGPLFDGIRRAIASGIMAAEAYVLAAQSGSFRGSNLSRYREFLSPLYDDASRAGRESFFSESNFAYGLLPKVLFSSSLFSQKQKRGRAPSIEDGTRRSHDLDSGRLMFERYAPGDSPVALDEALAARSSTKPWVPCCPADCFLLVTPKGDFTSYKDLFAHNMRSSTSLSSSSSSHKQREVEAYRATVTDIEQGSVRLDVSRCVACGTCGAIGPEEIVSFGQEPGGTGVRYRYG